MRWAAVHYVAPLSVVLGKGAPPNLPRRREPIDLPAVPEGGASPLPDVSAAAAAGGHVGARYLLGPGPWGEEVAALAAPVLAAGRSVLAVVPSVAEAARLAAALTGHFGQRVVAAADEGAAVLTGAWEAAQQPGRLLVGTREVALWPVSGPGAGRRPRRRPSRAQGPGHADDPRSRSVVAAIGRGAVPAGPVRGGAHHGGAAPGPGPAAPGGPAVGPGGDRRSLGRASGRGAHRGAGAAGAARRRGRRGPGLPPGGDPGAGAALRGVPCPAALPAVRGAPRRRRGRAPAADAPSAPAPGAGGAGSRLSGRRWGDWWPRRAASWAGRRWGKPAAGARWWWGRSGTCPAWAGWTWAWWWMPTACCGRRTTGRWRTACG